MIHVALFCSVNMFYVLFALGAGASVISGGCRSPLWGELPHARHCHFQPTPTDPPQGIAGPREREFRKGKNTRQKLGKIVWKIALWTPRWEKEGECCRWWCRDSPAAHREDPMVHGGPCAGWYALKNLLPVKRSSCWNRFILKGCRL